MQLAHLCNFSFVSGIFASVLKTEKVVPVFKEDSKPDYCNYRSISLNRILRKYLNNLCIKDCILFSIAIISYVTYNLVSDSIILHHMP